MNTTSRTIRNLSLTLVAGLSLIQAVQAGSGTYGPRNTVRFEPLPAEAQESCKPMIKHGWDGSNKSRIPVAVHDCPGAKVRKVKSWQGPRSTIPVNE